MPRSKSDAVFHQALRKLSSTYAGTKDLAASFRLSPIYLFRLELLAKATGKSEGVLLRELTEAFIDREMPLDDLNDETDGEAA